VSGWRSNLPLELLVSVKPSPAPPDEDGGPCMHFGCPRTGTATTGDLVACAFHRGDDIVRAGTRTIGHRAGDTQ